MRVVDLLGCAAAVSALPVSAAWANGRSATPSDPASMLDIRIKPDTAQNGVIRTLTITVTAGGVSVPQGRRLLTMPTVTNALVTSADDITGLTVSDAKGTIGTTIENVRQDGAGSDRYWIATRPVAGTLTWRYRVSVDPERPLLSLPMFELRSGFGSLSGAANAFMPCLVDTKPRRVSIHWDLSALPPRSVGLSSFGRGDVTSGPFTAADVSSSYYMVGMPGTYVAPDGGFFAGWQGTPPFDMTGLMRWAAGLHGYYGRFFDDPKGRFGVFARSNPLNPGSGVGLTNSFAFTFSDASRASDLRSLLAHEMLHVWVSSLDVPDGTDPLSTAWFGEGLAVYYQRALPYRAGAISATDFLADLNETAARYYTDIRNDVPNDAIGPAFWTDTRVRVIPYDRGSLYFAGVNARIAQESGGRRSLDDIVRAMLAQRRAGRPMTTATWLDLLRRQLGEKGVADWRAMMAGRRIDLPADTFGPCFTKVDRAIGLFDMGYDFVRTNAGGKIVQGLEPGSNAAKAGLRNGDIIRKGGPGDALQLHADREVTLDVERAGRPLAITYLPRGRPVLVPQWVERPDATDCRSPVSTTVGTNVGSG